MAKTMAAGSSFNKPLRGNAQQEAGEEGWCVSGMDKNNENVYITRIDRNGLGGRQRKLRTKDATKSANKLRRN